MNKLKIINTVYGDATGGRWQAMLNMADTLEQYGHEVILVRGEENAHLSSGERAITVLENRGFYSISAALRVRQWVKQQRPDLIIAHSGRAVWLFKNATIGMNIPVIAVNHSHNVKRTVRADAFIHITPHVQHLVQSLQSQKDKLNKPQKVISNLIHLPDEPAEPALMRQPPTILMLTRMIHTKGVHVLIGAIHKLQQKNIFVRAIIAGEGELKAHYEKMVEDYNLRDRISFPGWVNQAQKIELYHQADLVAVPSLVDIQPLGILDAFGWGKVVLSSDAIGPLQICQHQKNAWVSKADDAAALAEGIGYLITHPDEALALAKQAKKEAVERYCFAQIAKEHDAFVREVVAHYNTTNT
ncbi:glycosyltransferase family 4 protein [Alkanindiges sp. WGS2144]|uniref:glycosyltransferase family 4 protein n=1 Tax=Alkanindiges sp. WGS2144 TaxID=3366808 RepID=UPI003753E03E